MLDPTLAYATAKSAALYERARHVSLDGVHNWGFSDEPYPLYFTRAAGARLWDIDGNEYIELNGGRGPCVLGYNHPEVLQAVIAALTDQGPHFALPHPGEVELSEQLVELIPCAEKVGLTGGGGSDPCFHAVRVARAYTGRKKVIRFEGGMHGWVEPLSISEAPTAEEVGPYEEPNRVASPGTLPEVIANTIVLPVNDPAVLERRLAREGHEIAAIMAEPVIHNMGCVPLDDGFPQLLRQLCDHYGIVLIFDEMQTGFRHDIGGVQKLIGVTPDLGVFGKAMTNGYILSALVGKRKIMSLFQPEGRVRFSGTYNGHVLGVNAALKTIEILRRDNCAAYRKLFHLGRLVTDGMNEAIGALGIKAHVQSYGSVFALYFTERPVRNYRDLLPLRTGRLGALRQAYRAYALGHGVYVPRQPGGRCFLSTAHSEDDAAKVVDVTVRFLSEHQAELR